MEQKKTSQADLESERTTFFLMGLLVVMATLLVLFEWSTDNVLSPDWEGFEPIFMEEELIRITESPISGTISEVENQNSSQEIVYEDYNIVEEVSEQEIKESIVAILMGEIAQIHDAEIPFAELAQEMLEEIVYMESEVMPQFVGGNNALIRFIYSNIQYPEDALENKIHGRVWCSFIVNSDGSLSEIQIAQALHPSINQEAIRVLSLMPPWIPGSLNGKFVRVKCYLPIVFDI
jgi:protein TonB